MAITKQSFPPLIYVLRREDDTFTCYESEESVPAPVGAFAEVATYTFTEAAEYQRKVVLEKRALSPAPQTPPEVIL